MRQCILCVGNAISSLLTVWCVPTSRACGQGGTGDVITTVQCPLKHAEVTSTLTPSVRKVGFTWEMDKQAALRADSETTKKV